MSGMRNTDVLCLFSLFLFLYAHGSAIHHAIFLLVLPTEFLCSAHGNNSSLSIVIALAVVAGGLLWKFLL